MKKLIVLINLCAILSIGTTNAQQDRSHYLDFSSGNTLSSFYRIGSAMATPLVQGHRGTVEGGLPESSIAGFEYVIKQRTAVFEVDPRLTKDSVIVVFHDATLERTSNGKGKVIDHTWAELQQLQLKNKKGELTKYKIHTLSEVLEWARGKTALVLDKKDVPLQMIADLIRKHDANGYVMNMVRSPEDAKFYHQDNPKRMLSVSIRSKEIYQSYMDAGIPTSQMFACIGTELSDGAIELCAFLAKQGIRSLLATASSYDKLATPALRAQAYQKIKAAGISIIESDYPLELGEALSKNN